jgi:four helix bundle protein
MKDENELVDLRVRLRQYALRIIRLYTALPKSGAVHVISHQLLRAGTSPGAQFSEARRAKSSADFINKLEGALQELEESLYWIDLLRDGNFVPAKKLESLSTETNELIAILTTIVKTTKAKLGPRKR